MAHVVALVEHDAHNGTVHPSTRALLTLARTLGDPVAVVPGGTPNAETIRVLGHYGATEIWCREDSGTGVASSAPVASLAAGTALAPGISGMSVAPDTAVASPPVSAPAAEADVSPVSDTDLLAAVAHRLTPAAILIAASHRGQETAARLAIRLGSGIITDAVDVRPGPVAVQHCLANSHLVESSVVRGIPVITVRPEAAVAEPCPTEPILHTIAVESSPARVPRIVATLKPRPAHPALATAEVVVAGGRGIGSQAAFDVLAEVARVLGAAVAGSHTAAELGWIPPEARVGLTGATVHPRLYLACGVSGSVRHRAGMQGAETVVAIGDDPAAPIFKLAELGVVGDARAILPALLSELRARTHIPDPA